MAFTPTWGDAMLPETAASVQAQRFNGELVWEIGRHNPYPVPDHRNVLAQYRVARERCLAGGYDALLTVEHDMVLPENAVQNLAETPGDVVYGVYLFRWGVSVLNAFEYVGDRNIGESLSVHPKKARAAVERGVVRVSGCGWGCTLVRRLALMAIEFPESYPENPAYDIAFAQRAVRAGLMMRANFRVLCGHKQGKEILWPLTDDPHVEYSGNSFMVSGQALPLYRRTGYQTETVRARQTMNVLVAGSSKRLVCGQEYNLPQALAHDLARAAYVEVL